MNGHVTSTARKEKWSSCRWECFPVKCVYLTKGHNGCFQNRRKLSWRACACLCIHVCACACLSVCILERRVSWPKFEPEVTEGDSQRSSLDELIPSSTSYCDISDKGCLDIKTSVRIMMFTCLCLTNFSLAWTVVSCNKIKNNSYLSHKKVVYLEMSLNRTWEL